MPRINEFLKKTVFYIYVSEEEAITASPISATGLFFGVPLEKVKDQSAVYAISNKHVIDKVGKTPTLRINTKDGGFDIVKTEKANGNFTHWEATWLYVI